MEPFQLIGKSELLIHSNDVESPIKVFDADDGSDFGIINIKIKSIPITRQPLFLLFTIDRTGSMNECDIKMIRKIDQVKQTFKNLIRYLSNQSVQVYICVNAFNDTVETIIEDVQITKKNSSSLMHKIDELTPDGLTNIGEAILSAKHKLNTYAINNPNHQVGHIFMTDGEPTIGITNSNELKKLVNYTYSNTFIGYGVDHNAILLRELCENSNAEYLFVDKTENTSLVYGEAIHKFLYPAIKNVSIEIENGYIYDWRTNKWVSNLNENVLVGEIDKIYNIKITDYNNLRATISGNYGTYFENHGIVDILYPLPPLISLSGDTIPSCVDLTKYIFRQKVMEVLFSAKKNLHYNEKVSVKNNIKSLFKIITEYIQKNHYEDDAFMKTLCDDLSIVYNTIGMEYGNTYAISRHSAQGGQQSYNITTPLIKPPKLKRYDHLTHMLHVIDDIDNTNANHLHESEIVDDIDHYVISENVTNNYATPSMLRTMNSINEAI
jgi:Mg-chelatase subunit ChlD